MLQEIPVREMYLLGFLFCSFRVVVLRFFGCVRALSSYCSIILWSLMRVDISCGVLFFFLIYILNFYCGYRCIRAFGDKEKPVCLEGLKKRYKSLFYVLCFPRILVLCRNPK